MSPGKSNEAAKRARSQSRGRRAAETSPSNDEQQRRSRVKTEGMIFGDLEPVQYDKSIDPPRHACYNCWSYEHKRRFCTESRTHDYCCNCGRKGLTVDACPRCAKSFQMLRDDLKDWIYKNFFDAETSRGDHRHEQTTRMKETTGGNRENEEYGETNGKSNERKDEEFRWESTKSYHSLTTVYAEPNDLFAYMRDKKMRDEYETHEINEGEVNLDETRMADRDSFGENSIASVEDSPNGDEEVSRVTGQPIRDFLNLLDAVKHLPVKTQDTVVLQFMSERKKQMADNEMRSVNKVKFP